MKPPRCMLQYATTATTLLFVILLTATACNSHTAQRHAHKPIAEIGRGRILRITDQMLATGGSDTVRFGRLHSGEIAGDAPLDSQRNRTPARHLRLFTQLRMHNVRVLTINRFCRAKPNRSHLRSIRAESEAGNSKPWIFCQRNPPALCGFSSKPTSNNTCKLPEIDYLCKRYVRASRRPDSMESQTTINS